MADLPVPAEVFFSDFSFDLVEYQIERSGEIISSAKGLLNKDEDGRHIAFMYGTDVRVGDVLLCNKPIKVKNVCVDTFEGNPELLKAYF